MFDEKNQNNEEYDFMLAEEPQEEVFVGYELSSPVAKKKKKSGGVKVVALALACALIGGAAGGGAVYLASMSGQGDAVATQAETLAVETTEVEAAQEATEITLQTDAASSTPLLVTSGSQSGEKLDPSEVYAQNVNAVVGINTETTTTNYLGQESSTASSGSGFIITSDGYVVTNAHVVSDDDVAADTVSVVLTSGETYPAEIIGFDTDNDVALLKIEATGLPTVTIGDSDGLVVGEMVCAIGNPLGELTNTLTVGYVSALDREINTDGTPINMLQTDCAINPGNSGGPLFDMYGNVIGITTAKYSTSSSTTLEGLGFALPINDVMAIVADLQQYGYVTGKPYLGISVTSLNVTMASYYNLPVGVYINSVESGSCSQAAGLTAGDIITAMDDTQIQTYTELVAAMRAYKAGDTVTLTVYRSSSYITVTVTFDEKIPDSVTEQVEQTETESQQSSGGFGGFSSGGSSRSSSLPSSGSSNSGSAA